ncbi:N-acetylmuramoyl-L-alanine amidase [Alkaliphilus sp. B6464]|uniref:N-acetylmuramoyl-L-alanine amidase n=1 Tax=Alkaliphilus sp. B6464 TaxID=2731219 RepID=UPI001BAB4AD1|nr:N-acetylmuramoyl-L-alanine amidase [Alkaliphilus sp. B6464]QUH19516.1 N-acetylmuramoyl-L-alanine amidase [Alkaliphilus sp. B6464]
MSYSIYKVFIDAGHGGSDPGAVNGNFYEKDFALDIAKHTRDRLNSYGVQTRMSRETDIKLTPNQRAAASDAYGANILVSIHNNAGGGTGIETWKHDNSSSYVKQLAQAVNNKLVSSLGVRDRGVKSAPSQRGENIYVIDPVATKAWAILPEILFMDTIADLEKLKSSTFRRNAGYAIADGIISFINTLPPMQ